MSTAQMNGTKTTDDAAPHMACVICREPWHWLPADERLAAVVHFGLLPRCYGDACPVAPWPPDSHLFAQRLNWLALQSIMADVPLEERWPTCKPMIGDPEPRFWPAYADQLERQRSRVAFASSGRLSKIDRIKATYRVEDVAGRLTRLYGTGDVLKGKCPLHNERNGQAFVVWVTDQRWKCFGKCGTLGDVIDLAELADSRGLRWAP